MSNVTVSENKMIVEIMADPVANAIEVQSDSHAIDITQSDMVLGVTENSVDVGIIHDQTVVIEIIDETILTVFDSGAAPSVPSDNDQIINLDSMINPDHPSSSREFEYGQDGNITAIRVFDGATQLFERIMNYDLSGRIESVVTDDLIGNTQLTKNISYGAGGAITGVTREVVSI